MFIRSLLLGGLLLSTLGSNAQTSLTKLGSIDVPGTAVELTVNGTTAYVLTASAGSQMLRVYDVSVPALPRLLSSLALPDSNNPPPRHAVISGNTLYVSTYPSFASTPHSEVLLAIDISNAMAPTLRSTYSGFAGGDELHLAAIGNTLYAVHDHSTRLYVLDSNLKILRTVPVPYSLSGILGLRISGTTAYVQYGNPAFATLDLTDPLLPVSSGGTTPGTISAVSGTQGYGLQEPAYENSVPSNTLRFYDISSPLAPVLVRSLPGTYGTRVAAGAHCVFTIGETSPYRTSVASSTAPLRGYYQAAGSAAVEAVDPTTSGANALAVVGNTAYVLTDTNLSLYTFASTVTATRGSTALSPLPFYPNPVRDKLTLPKLAPGSVVTIYDAAGRSCLQTALPASGTIDVSSLRTGLYQVRVGAATRKLLVE